MSLARLTRTLRLPRVRLALGLLAFAAVTAVTVAIAEPRIATGFFPYDDEGYMLVALDSFIDQGGLYDDVFSQYGPFYFEFWAAFFSVFGIPLDHDGGRTATMFAWVVTSLMAGLATWRMTRSVLLGLATQPLVFTAIITLANEPMHSGGLICILLGSILAISCLVRAGSAPLALGLLGGAVAALVLVKVNVGLFALVSVAMACAVSYPALARRRLLRPAVEVAFVALPLLVLFSKLGEAWARDYAVHVAIAALAVVVALRARPAGNRDGEELWWLGGGLVAVGLTVIAALLASGTSPAGLIEGVVTQPLRQSDVFSLPLALSRRIYLFDFLALVGAISFWYLSRRRDRTPSPGFTAVVSLLSILVGMAMALSVLGRGVLFDPLSFPAYQFGFLAFAWVALAPLSGEDDADTSFARLLLPLLAVLQALHAYPVAGSQVMWSTFLLIPVGALCVANGAHGLVRAVGDEGERRALGAIATVAAAIALVVIGNVYLRQALDAARGGYDTTVPLRLAGVDEPRLLPHEAAVYREVTRAIDEYCASLVTLPGMNSFYIWADREPPTGLNATAWMELFDDERQQRVVEATRGQENLCLLENESLAGYWMRGREAQGPLVDYLRQGFRPIAQFDEYKLLRREGPAGSGA
ncbi:MAG: hypothetical protein M3Y75_00990 [Actinomycetota bacterium]|nr:hypothetical protein [Actinomycetota bacterium]